MIYLGALFLFACIFSYTNGFQDASSVAASPIASRSLSRVHALWLTVIFELLGALLGGSLVANSIYGITTYPRNESFLLVLVCGLGAAILWNFFTRMCKLPSSSTHALVGGLIGAIYGAAGNFDCIIWGRIDHVYDASGVAKVLVTLFVSPLAGFIMGYFSLKLLYFLLSRATTRVSKIFRFMQWFLLPILAFGHGANDSQKVMGILVLGLSVEHISGLDAIPFWVRLVVGVSLALGVVAMAPGLVRRVGQGIYRQRGVHGFVTELCSAMILLTGSLTGGPISTSQVIASCVMGVGSADRRKGVKWLVAKDMFFAWFLTIPLAGFVAYLMARLLRICHDLFSA